ncbi:hypothetical protein MRX96_034163 [Rhipicephalus microplus]
MIREMILEMIRAMRQGNVKEISNEVNQELVVEEVFDVFGLVAVPYHVLFLRNQEDLLDEPEDDPGGVQKQVVEEVFVQKAIYETIRPVIQEIILVQLPVNQVFYQVGNQVLRQVAVLGLFVVLDELVFLDG